MPDGIVVHFALIVIEVNLEHPLNISSPKLVSVLGITTEVIAHQ